MAPEKPTPLTGRHYQTGRPVQVEVAEGRIVAVRESGERAGENLSWIAPGFLDVQCNGYGGQEFSSLELTVEKVAEIARVQASFGVTQFSTSSVTTIAMYGRHCEAQQQLLPVHIAPESHVVGFELHVVPTGWPLRICGRNALRSGSFAIGSKPGSDDGQNVIALPSGDD